jgi:hypothetical protein
MADTTAPAIGISISLDMEGRHLVLQSHVARDAEQDEIDGVMDKIYNLAERMINRRAFDSLGYVMESLIDKFEDDTRAYLKSIYETNGMEDTLASLMPGERERDTTEAKNKRTELSTKINHNREAHNTYLVNKEAHEFTLQRLRAKRDVHFELSK